MRPKLKKFKSAWYKLIDINTMETLWDETKSGISLHTKPKLFKFKRKSDNTIVWKLISRDDHRVLWRSTD